ncbi:hypothetical protein RRG08_058918 [Elysia crispata]|uniref:Uncharacterized protein n=1 Tax=Elysia crispata TaxID=231223 RepID=A0AAE1CL40_9GAST|nr:hypothetical protein RRG08_058918 [Elysia crispata]
MHFSLPGEVNRPVRQSLHATSLEASQSKGLQSSVCDVVDSALYWLVNVHARFVSLVVKLIQRISSIRNYAFVYYGTSSCVFHVDLAENFKMSLSQQYTWKTRRELLGAKHDTSNLYKGVASKELSHGKLGYYGRNRSALWPHSLTVTVTRAAGGRREPR